MTQNEPGTVSKLLIDREDDFRFHCAYLAYSKAWDENESDEAREKLNGLIESLSNNSTNYHDFYNELNRFRIDIEYRSYDRIQTQRKREWRQKEARRSRNWRHKRR